MNDNYEYEDERQMSEPLFELWSGELNNVEL